MQSKTFLCVAAGAHSIKIGQFELSNNLKLTGFASEAIGSGRKEDSPPLARALKESLARRSFKPRETNLSAPSSMVFSKVLKFPPVDSSKLRQMIPYEAQQNIPFSFTEAVWDYQILNEAASGELEVFLAAAKGEAIEEFFHAVDASGLRLNVLDAAPAALHNAFRFNYPEQEGCAALLDIGARTSNLLIFDKGRFFTRTIGLGANSITTETMGETRFSYEQAEALKIREGFVGLGGAYEEPENRNEACIAKVARQFMTRLHIQVNQTLQSWRAQQGGSAPTKLFLAGGGSSLPFTAEFFKEKLGIEVEYFNPFRGIEIDSSVSADDLAKRAHLYGEVVGLALRNLAHCPLEINLIPKSIRAKQEFARRRPFIAVAMAALGLFMVLYGLFLAEISKIKRESLTELTPKLEKLKVRLAALRAEEQAIEKARNEINILGGHLRDKFIWADRLTEMRQILVDSERMIEQATGKPTGVWIERLGIKESAPVQEDEAEQFPSYSILEYMRRDPAMAARLFPPEQLRRMFNAQVVESPEKLEVKPDGTPNIFATFRAVNLNSADHPAENGGLAYVVEQAFKTSTLFDTQETKLRSLQPEEEGAVTFTFDMQLKARGLGGNGQ